MMRAANEASKEASDKTFEPLKYNKGDLLQKFTTRYNLPLTLENQPSEATLALVAKLHAKRACDFAPLSKVTSAADNRDTNLEPHRIKGTPFLPPHGLVSTKRNTTFLSSSDAFAHAVRILMNTYALVSMADADVTRCWCSLAAALAHVHVVENLLRANALAGNAFLDRIADSEKNVRTEWMRLGQTQANTPLSDIITTVGQNVHLWPLTSEFKSYRDVRRGGKDGGKHNAVRDSHKGGKGKRQDQSGSSHTCGRWRLVFGMVSFSDDFFPLFFGREL